MKDKNLLLAPFAIALSLLVLPARGDEPLRPPHRFTECSPSGHSCVTSDPKQGTFAHKPGNPDPKSAIWKIPSWFRVLYPGDNPDLLVTGYDGENLVPAEAPGEIKIVSFWRHGKLLRSYKLSELVHDLRHLRPTVSHLYWGDYDGFDADGNFRLTTVEAKVLVFDPAKGSLLRSMRRVG